VAHAGLGARPQRSPAPGFRRAISDSFGAWKAAEAQRVALVTRDAWRYSQDMLDWSRCEAVEREPSKLGGAWTFKETRVPVRALFENLEDGASIDQFLEWFPGVPRCHVEGVLEHVARSLTESRK